MGTLDVWQCKVVRHSSQWEPQFMVMANWRDCFISGTLQLSFLQSPSLIQFDVNEMRLSGTIPTNITAPGNQQRPGILLQSKTHDMHHTTPLSADTSHATCCCLLNKVSDILGSYSFWPVCILLTECAGLVLSIGNNEISDTI